MATSLIAKPQSITPAYNPIKFIYDSTNNAEPGFRYIFDIYASGTVTKIAEYRVLPNLDGYGEVDLSRLLQNYVSWDFDPTDYNGFDATKSYYKYDVKVGEEYQTDVSYTASLTQNGLYTTITATHSFQVGDQVVITQVDGGAANPNLEGLFTVTSINTTVDFTVNSLWSEITDATIDGTVAYADGRKTVTRDIITSTNNYVWNSAFPFVDFRAYDENNYILDNSADSLCTNMPSGFHMTVNQEMWINFMNNGVTTGYIYFENSTGDIFRRLINDTGLITMEGCGAYNYGTVTVVSGSSPVVDADVEWYDFWYANSAGTQHSQKYRVYIDRRCTINDYEILFLDRKGSMGSFAFQLKDRLTGQVIKDTYNQDVEGYVQSQEWTYYSREQGFKVINPRIEEVYELNTNWMTEDEAAYFAELVSSPITYLKVEGQWLACIVQDTGYEKERQRNRNLIRKTLKVKLSVQDRING